jgi:hypothetical protein
LPAEPEDSPRNGDQAHFGLEVATSAEMSRMLQEGEVYVVCMIRRKDTPNQQAGVQWVKDLIEVIREFNGQIQLQSWKPEAWEIYEGKDNFVEPNHLNPAIFDFNAIVLAAFPDDEVVQAWWGSDKVFEMMKYRDPIDAVGIYTVDGMAVASDVKDPARIAFGDKYVLFEFHKMLSFKPMQQYCDSFYRYAQASRVKPIFSDSIKNTLCNEFPLDAVCGTSWKQLLEAKLWRNNDVFQSTMVDARSDHGLCLSILIPMYEATVDDIKQAKKLFALQDTMKRLSSGPFSG